MLKDSKFLNSDLIYNQTYVIPHGQFCYGISLETDQNIVLACDICLTGQCIQVWCKIETKVFLVLFQTCCPPGHVYAQDESWEPPRCSSEGAAEDVNITHRQKQTLMIKCFTAS